MGDIFDYFKKVQDELLDTINGVFSVDYKKPMSDITHNKKAVILNIRLPNVDKKDVILEVHKDRVFVKAEHRKQKIRKTAKKYSSEKIYRGFSRTILLPEGLDTEKANAVFKRDVLTITIPKLNQRKSRIFAALNTRKSKIFGAPKTKKIF